MDFWLRGRGREAVSCPFKGLDKDLEYLNFKHGHVWVFSDNIENEEYRTAHTRKELEEAGFGWVFDCEGIEVEEVE